MGILYRIKRNSFKKILSYASEWVIAKENLPAGVDLGVDIRKRFNHDQLKTVFDVGANIGQTTCEFLKMFPSAQIHSFEPVSHTFKILQSEFSKNSRVKCYPLAFGNTSGEQQIRLFESDMSKLNSLSPHGMNQDPSAITERIQVQTLDKFTKDQGIDTIDLLKIDTEGFEVPVLEGASHLIQENRVRLVYCEVGFTKANNRNTYFPQLVEMMENWGFVFFSLYEISHIQFYRQTHYGNALFVNKNHLPQP